MKTLATKFLIPTLLGFFLASCASLPQKEYQTATQYKQKSQQYKIANYAPEEFAKADAAFVTASNFYTNNKKGKAKKSLTEANALFVVAIEKGMPLYADDLEKMTTNKVGAAKASKADIAVKNEYKAANDLLVSARAAEEKKDYEKAIELYQQAITKFEQATTLAEEKKVKAVSEIGATEEQIRKAKQSIEALSVPQNGETK